MADNKMKEQLDNIITGDEKLNDSFLYSLAYGSNPFEGFSAKDLKNVLSLVPENHPFRERIAQRINELMPTDNINQATSDQPQPSPADSQTQTSDQPQPSPSGSQTRTTALPNLDILLSPSYSLYEQSVRFADALYRNDNPDEDLPKLQSKYDYIVENAQRIIDLAAKDFADNKEITPEQAVFLKDYMEILNYSNLYKNYNPELQAEIEKQLQVFDEENGLDDLSSVSAQNLELHEVRLHDVAHEFLKELYREKPVPEVDKIISNLVVQEMKMVNYNDPVAIAIKEAAQSGGKSYEELYNFYQECLKGAELSEQQQITFNLLYQSVQDKISDIYRKEINNFTNRFLELRDEMEATKAIERIKLAAEELYPEKDGMSPEEIEEQRQKREKYIKAQLENKDGLPSKVQWIEQCTMRALRNKYPKLSDKSDVDLFEEKQKEYFKLREQYEIAANEIDTSVNTAYVLKIEQLACRSARLTGANDINGNTQAFLNDYSQTHKDSFKAGKLAMSIGKSIAITQGIRYGFGFKGMAVYSAYQTGKAVKKSYGKYKDSLPAGERGSFLGYCSYLRDNPKELTDVVSKVSKTAVMSTLAVAGTALGIDNIPGVSAAIVGAINGATILTKGYQWRKEIADKWKNRGQIWENWKENHPKLAKFAKKHKWAGLAVVGTLASAATLYAIFKPDEVENIVENTTADLTNNTDLTNKGISLDGQKTVEGASLDGLTKPVNLFEGYAPNQPVLAEVNGAGLGQDAVHIGTNAPKFDDITNSGSNAAESAQDADATENAQGSDAAENAQAVADEHANFDLFADKDTEHNIEHFVGYPKFSADKLHELGLIDEKTADELSSAGGTRKTLAKLHELNENASPETKAKLAEYKEWINDKDARQAEINQYEHLRKVRQMAKEAKENATNGLGTGGSNEANTEEVEEQTKETEDANQLTEFKHKVSGKKRILGIFNKSTPEQEMSVTYNTKEKLAELANYLKSQGYKDEEIQNIVKSRDFDKIAREQMAEQYMQENKVGKAEITDENGRHVYYQDKTNKAGELIEKQKDIDNDNHKTTEIRRTADNGNGATYIKYKGKEEVYTFIDRDSNQVVHIGSENKDQVLRVVEDPQTGTRTTLVKGDDGKKYTIITNMKNGTSTVQAGISASAMKKLYDDARGR